MNIKKRVATPHFILLIAAIALPLIEQILPMQYRIADLVRPIFILAFLAVGLNVITGYCGLLHLGVAAFMAIGAYAYAILTCDIYPFQLSFWSAFILAGAIGAASGILLGLPSIRLRGDYLAIVTLGFGEIVQDILRNLDVITKGTQGINPLPAPTLFGQHISNIGAYGWYYLLLILLLLAVWFTSNLERSRLGRAWFAIREDELASGCMGIRSLRMKLMAFALTAALSALGGSLWAAYLGTSGEPGNYDFQISIIALCAVVVGGMGSIVGVLLGSLIMVGFNSIFLVKLSHFLVGIGLASSDNVFSQPNNWKYMVFGLALIIMMRFRPDGLFGAGRER